MLSPGSAILRWAGRLRFPKLVLLAGALLLVNLVVPDPLPWVDEVLIGLVTLMLASFRRRKGSHRNDPTAEGDDDSDPARGPVVDVEAEEVRRD